LLCDVKLVLICYYYIITNISSPSRKFYFLKPPICLKKPVLFNSTETQVKTDIEMSKETKPKAHQKKNVKMVNFPHF